MGPVGLWRGRLVFVVQVDAYFLELNEGHVFFIGRLKQV